MTMAVCKLGAANQSIYDGWQKEVDLVTANIKQIEKFMRMFDEKFGQKNLTNIYDHSENLWVVEFPVFWSKATYLISLYSLVIRCCPYWDGQTDIMEWLYGKGDVCPEWTKFKTAKPKIEAILAGKMVEQTAETLDNGNGVHGRGISYTPISEIIGETNVK